MDPADAGIAAGLVLFGFLLSAGWQAFTDSRSSKAVRKRLLTNLKMEIDQNAARCQTLVNLINQLPAGNHGIMPLPELSTAAWTFAVADWDNLKLEANLAAQLGDINQQARQINEGFRIRQQFSTLMIPLGSYQQGLIALDTAIVADLTRYVTLKNQVQPSFESLLGTGTPS